MRAKAVSIPAVAGVIYIAWGFVATIDNRACDGVTYEDAVDSWAAIGVLTSLLLGAIGAALLSFRLQAWPALMASALIVLAIALGAQLGYAIGMALAECEWQEGPALTLLLFTTPAALFGYAIGWVLRRAEV